MLDDPAIVQIAAKGETADTVEQLHRARAPPLKPDLLAALFEGAGAQARHRLRPHAPSGRCCLPQAKASRLPRQAIHSDRSQNQRKRALDNFASGGTDILVATDVLARGIDVDRSVLCGELRRAHPGRGLRAPHRPHGPRRSRRLRDHLRQPREQRRAGGHREAHQARHPRRLRSRASTGRGRRGRSRARHAGQCPPRPRAGSGRPRARQEGEAPRQGEGACRSGCRRVAPARHAQKQGGKSAGAAHSSRKSGTGSKAAPKSKAPKGGNRAKTDSAAASGAPRTSSDFRPGRAHRAAVAAKRSGGKRRG